MKKCILPVSLLSAALVGVAISNSVLADPNVTSSTYYKPGFYAGVEGGRTDTSYKGKTFVHTQPSTSNTVTTTYPLNFSVDTTTSTSMTTNNRNVDDVGLGGRIYAGYQFNPYFALETGYTQYAKTTFNANGVSTYKVTDVAKVNNVPEKSRDSDTKINNYLYAGEITEHAIDVVGKATLPLNNGFGLYAKAGAAYITADRHINSRLIGYSETKRDDYGNVSTSVNDVNILQTDYTKTYNAVRPVAGMGVNYTIPNSNMSVEASYSRVFTSGAIPNASLLAVGLGYKFG